jgi:hypothetical protein
MMLRRIAPRPLAIVRSRQKKKGAESRALIRTLDTKIQPPLFHDPTDVGCCSGFPSLTTHPSFN